MNQTGRLYCDSPSLPSFELDRLRLRQQFFDLATSMGTRDPPVVFVPQTAHIRGCFVMFRDFQHISEAQLERFLLGGVNLVVVGKHFTFLLIVV